MTKIKFEECLYKPSPVLAKIMDLEVHGTPLKLADIRPPEGDTDEDEVCKDCDNDPCTCDNCQTCGYEYCECCGDCDSYPCACFHDDEQQSQTFISYGRYRGIENPPQNWPIELWHPSIEGIRDDAWKTTWDLERWEVSLAKSAAEFYTLEALTSKTIYPHKIEPTQSMLMRGITETAVDKIVVEAQQKFDKLVTELDDIFVRYSIMAVGGESRHHYAIGGKVLPGPDHRPWAWEAWKPIYDHVGPQVILDLIPYFLEMSGSFGGEAWATVCRIVHSRLVGELPPRLFVDRCFTLQHNSGCFFNKVFSVRHMDEVLPLHGLDTFPVKQMLSYCGPEVKAIWVKYWDACNTYMGLALTYD